MVEACLRDFKVRASTSLLCKVASFWKREPRPVLSLLAAHGARMNGHTERRPLLHAVYHGNTHMAEALIEMKADPRSAVDGETPLHVAVRRRRRDAVTLLLARGASVDAPDMSGRTPRMLAEVAWRSHAATCPVLACYHLDERRRIRSQIDGAGFAASLPWPELPRAMEAEAGDEAESEESSTDGEDAESEISDVDDLCPDDEEGEEEDTDDDC